jgi:hypothetical protein
MFLVIHLECLSKNISIPEYKKIFLLKQAENFLLILFLLNWNYYFTKNVFCK